MVDELNNFICVSIFLQAHLISRWTWWLSLLQIIIASLSIKMGRQFLATMLELRVFCPIAYSIFLQFPLAHTRKYQTSNKTLGFIPTCSHLLYLILRSEQNELNIFQQFLCSFICHKQSSTCWKTSYECWSKALIQCSWPCMKKDNPY